MVSVPFYHSLYQLNVYINLIDIDILDRITLFCLLFLGLLISMVQLFEIRSERAELKRQLRQLQTQQDRLITQYESGIDMDAVTWRAEELGMHIPWAEQIRYIPVEGTGTEAPGAEADGEDPEEALSGDKENQEAYFP